MESKRLSLPDQNTDEYSLGLAYRLVCEQLAGIEDIEQQCLKSGAQYYRNTVSINYLSRPHLITLAGAEVTGVTGETVPLKDKILILHYFTQAKGTPLSGKMITHKELPDGINYYTVFYKRAIKPLVDHFGSEPHRLLDIAGTLGGHKADYGDMAVTIDAFSRVPITLVLWKGDTEFAPEGNILFDSTIPDYLTTDDINVLCETIAWRLVRLLKAGGDNPGKS